MTAPKKTARAAKPAAPQTAAEPHPERLAAVKDEATRSEQMEPADLLKVVQWRGTDVRVPPTVDDWDIEIQEYAEDGQLVKHLRALLGSQQWAELKGAHTPMKFGDVRDLQETIMRDAYGQTAGE
ncbi:hypothetical protein KIK06_23380 [Nocardiopsis sp. EMB25]|uniref:hypothetical protein n=1 Tax=Nocardiopsis sp. EMB25 TaxID=2835867 RepID=UPI002283C03C|nr:hypothetical protein [Nocardiopsis sp. EMB25]MCY9786829.1 hypothetical protein [Nocardiopsis sp. EMB25]